MTATRTTWWRLFCLQRQINQIDIFSNSWCFNISAEEIGSVTLYRVILWSQKLKMFIRSFEKWATTNVSKVGRHTLSFTSEKFETRKVSKSGWVRLVMHATDKSRQTECRSLLKNKNGSSSRAFCLFTLSFAAQELTASPLH